MIAQELKGCPLFMGIEDRPLALLLTCLMATRRTYQKDHFIFRADSKASLVGLVLSGGVFIIQEDFRGKRVILGHMKPGELFAEEFSCITADKLPVSVIAAEKSEILLMDYQKIVTPCPSACTFHVQIIKNMLRILAEKNMLLLQKIEHLSKGTTKEKLLSFLSEQASKAGSSLFTIPFNRQELADYLCVDRSALSRELSLMEKEGLLRYNKNHFELIGL